jgi:cytochrome c oxidase subunit 3
MDLTQGTETEKRARSKKMMLWFAIVSLSMMFAGLASAYIVSRSREDWVNAFDLPQAFTYSTILIVVSSITYILAKKCFKKLDQSKGMLFLWLTLLLGSAFVYFQFTGFSKIVSQGFYFTGAESTPNSSFIYLIVMAHLAHLAAGLISLLVVIYNASKQRYKPGQMLGIELGANFWHFLDILWVLLFVFLTVYK